eukprot:3460270-Prorocentrum_lima.AAC.1
MDRSGNHQHFMVRSDVATTGHSTCCRPICFGSTVASSICWCEKLPDPKHVRKGESFPITLDFFH